MAALILVESGETHPQRPRCWADCSPQSRACVFPPDRQRNSWCYNLSRTNKCCISECLYRSELSRRSLQVHPRARWRTSCSQAPIGAYHILCPVCCSLDPEFVSLRCHCGYILGVWQRLASTVVYPGRRPLRYIEPDRGTDYSAHRRQRRGRLTIRVRLK
jgi:hypothetical protein